MKSTKTAKTESATPDNPATPAGNSIDPRDKSHYEPGGIWEKYAKLKGRVFTIMSDLVHPDTGQVLHTLDSLEAAATRKGVAKSAWIIHDKDIWDAADAQSNTRAQVGCTKPVHFHAVEAHTNETLLSTVACAWGVPPNFVKIFKGRGVFEDNAEYLTHEHPTQQAQGKYRYPDDEVHAYGFDFRQAVNQRQQQRENKNNRDSKSSKVHQMIIDIQENGLTLAQAKLNDPDTFAKTKYDLARKARREYLNTAPLPSKRTNYYFGGAPGTGKSTLALIYAYYLARKLYPELLLDDAIFIAGRKHVTLQSYTGQPIIIWDDYRPSDFIKALGSPSSFFQTFDIKPKKNDVNIKYGAARLINAYNIVTGVLDYREFLDNLAGEYTDGKGESHKAENKNQAYRRFPFVLTATTGKFWYNMSRGFTSNTTGGVREWQQYDRLATFPSDIPDLAEDVDLLETLALEMEAYSILGENFFSDLLDADKQLRQKCIDSKAVLDRIKRNSSKKLLLSPNEAEFDELSAQIELLYQRLEKSSSKVDELTIKSRNGLKTGIDKNGQPIRHIPTKLNEQYINFKTQVDKLDTELKTSCAQLVETPHFIALCQQDNEKPRADDRLWMILNRYVLDLQLIVDAHFITAEHTDQKRAERAFKLAQHHITEQASRIRGDQTPWGLEPGIANGKKEFFDIVMWFMNTAQYRTMCQHDKQFDKEDEFGQAWRTLIYATGNQRSGLHPAFYDAFESERLALAAYEENAAIDRHIEQELEQLLQYIGRDMELEQSLEPYIEQELERLEQESELSLEQESERTEQELLHLQPGGIYYPDSTRVDPWDTQPKPAYD